MFGEPLGLWESRVLPSGSRPGPHPLPPSDLSSKSLPIESLDQVWFRFHGAKHPCLYWGLVPPRPFPCRFDSPKGEYGVIYVAADEYGAFIETFGHNTGIRMVSHADLVSRHLSDITFSRPLRLVDLTGPGLGQIGADARLLTGDYGVAQQWALAFFMHPLAPDGIYYRSRHDNERMCAAVFDRGGLDATTECLGSLVDSANAPLLWDLLGLYKLGYVPS